MKTKAYTRYLSSYEWKWKRYRTLRRAFFACQWCGKDRGKLDVHHKHYHSIGCEIPGADIIVLCQSCHRKYHEKAS